MITEDFVSFDVAKLLKEKGFDAECDYLYVDGELVRAQGCACNWNEGESLYTDYKNECSAPTLQMAMKWLREVHNKQCNIELNFYSKWHFLVVDTKVTEIDHYEQMKSYPTDNSDGFSSYEEAAEVAIKYCLENLI